MTSRIELDERLGAVAKTPAAGEMLALMRAKGIGDCTWLTAKRDVGIGSRLDGTPGQPGQHWRRTYAARAFACAGQGKRGKRCCAAA